MFHLLFGCRLKLAYLLGGESCGHNFLKPKSVYGLMYRFCLKVVMRLFSILARQR